MESRLGHLRVDKIRPHHINNALYQLRTDGRSARTCNLELTCLRSVLKAAKIDGHVQTVPTADIGWMKTEQRPRSLVSPETIDSLCRHAMTATKNGTALVDYIRFLQFTGAREKEGLRVKWADVDFERKLVLIGIDGDTKNRESRFADMNPSLETHLIDMRTRKSLFDKWNTAIP